VCKNFVNDLCPGLPLIVKRVQIKNTSISVSGTTEESTQIKFHLKRESETEIRVQ